MVASDTTAVTVEYQLEGSASVIALFVALAADLVWIMCFGSAFLSFRRC